MMNKGFRGVKHFVAEMVTTSPLNRLPAGGDPIFDQPLVGVAELWKSSDSVDPDSRAYKVHKANYYAFSWYSARTGDSRKYPKSTSSTGLNGRWR
jgi:hypothetical protein